MFHPSNSINVNSRVLELPGLCGLETSVNALSPRLHLTLRGAVVGLELTGGLHLLVLHLAEHVQGQPHHDLFIPTGQKGVGANECTFGS